MAQARVEAALAADPEDPRLLIALGEVFAGLNDTERAVRLAREAMQLMPRSRDAVYGSHIELQAIVRVLGPAGAANEALETLDAYLSAPGNRTIEALSRDPRLDPVRDHPRFEKLIEKHGGEAT